MGKVKRKNQCRVLIAALLSVGLAGQVIAAKVPAGVELAEQQHLVRNNGTEVQSLDPHKTSGTPEHVIQSEMLEGLVIYDPNGRIIAGTAERWQSDDFKVWTFYLRQQAKWSNGEPVIAEDFVYSFRRLVDPNTAAPYASYLAELNVENAAEIVAGNLPPEALGVKALDAHTLQITLQAPLSYFAETLAHSSVLPLNSRVIAAHGERWTQPQNWVGNGAYKLKSWVVNKRIVVERNPHYWNNAQTVIDQVTFLPLQENADVNRYRAGEVEITNISIPRDMLAKFRHERPAEVRTYPYLCTYNYDFNHQQPPLDNAKVRRALKLAFDPEIITNKVNQKGDIPAYTFTPPYTEGARQFKHPEWWPRTA